MEVTDIAALVGIAKDVKGIWDRINGNDQEKLDAVVRKLGEVLIKDPTLEKQKQFLVKGTDKLPMRLAGLALDKELRKRVSRHTTSKVSDGLAVVKCRQCGALQELEL